MLAFLFRCQTWARVRIASQDEWLEQQFKECAHGAHHVVLLSHVPPFVGHEDEVRQ